VRKSTLLPVALLSAAVLATACSSGGGNTQSASTNGSAVSTGAASGSTWNIGSIGSYTGPEQSSMGPTGETISAWADWVNATGGIDGHKIKLYNFNDASSPSQSESDVKQLIQQDHVIAIVADDSVVDSTWASYVQQQGVPVIGASWEATFESNPDFFPAGSTLLTTEYASMAEAKKMGKTNYSLFYCSEVADCAQAANQVKTYASQAGVQVKYTAAISSSASNYTAPCLQAKQDGVNAIEVAEASAAVIQVFSSCAAQGYHPQVLANGGTVTKSWLSASALNGALAIMPNFPVFDKSTAAEQTFESAMEKYAPGLTSQPGFGENEAETWVSGLLFEAAAKAANLGDNPTPAQVVSGLYALHGETLDGLAPPLTFQHGVDHQVNCWFVMGIANGSFTTPRQLQTDCWQGRPQSS
jgi:branched-chain amino acid transport system substrate-binding protein